MIRTDKKIIRAFVPPGVKSSEVFRFKKVPAYDNINLLRPTLSITRHKTDLDSRPVKITIEVLDK
ncbi:MAG: hypothetical protein M1469_01125 [Bacteroidetes bacterium]|nr:hypothetical protein [Bacteroidota bacterium]